MQRIGKKISWLVKRHPYLYYTRFKLLSKEGTLGELANYSYNTINKKQTIPKSFQIISSIIFQEKACLDTLEKVIQISKWLRIHIKGGSGLSLSSEKALQKMLAGEGGVCSDVSQVFNNFCVVNDIKVREWGITSKPFNSNFGGHAFNEFYSKELEKWILIDVSKSMMFYLEDSVVPLSVIELFEYNNSGKKVVYKSFLESNKVDIDIIQYYYLNKERVPFLICNYHNKTYDTYLDRFQSYVPIFMIHFWLFMIRKSYYYLFPMEDFKKNLVYDR